MTANRIWGIATALIVVLSLALGWLLGVSPLLSQAAQADEERAGVEGNNAAQQILLTSLMEKAANVEQYKAELKVLRGSSIPAMPDIRDLFVYLDDVADAADIDIVSASAEAPIVYGLEGEGEPSIPLPTGRLAETLYRMALSITVAGDPQDVLAFIHRLQASTAATGRLLTVPTVTIDWEADTQTFSAYAFIIDNPNVPASVTDEPVEVPEDEPTAEETPAPEGSETPAPGDTPAT